jgi:hypothetical protein
VESLGWRLRSGICTLPKTGAAGFANPVPLGLPGSDSPLLLTGFANPVPLGLPGSDSLLLYLFGLNSNLVYGLRISSLMNIECLHSTNTNNQVDPPI